MMTRIWERPSAYLLAVLAAAGLATSVWMMDRAPDGAVSFPDGEAALLRAYRDAERLGYRPGEKRYLALAAGSRALSSVSDIQVLTEKQPDGAVRRRLLRQAPPIRLGVRFYDSVGPEGFPGTLRLEYDGKLRLIAASFNFDGPFPSGPRQKHTADFADKLAEQLLGTAPPEPEEIPFGEVLELVYRVGDDEPGVHVLLSGTARWMAHLQPEPYPLFNYQAHRVATAGEQIRLYLLVVAVLVGLGLLFWRLSRRRAGFAQSGLLAGVLGFGLLPALPVFLEPIPVRFLIGIYYLLTQLGVFLMWIVGEAELREVRPGSIEHWDRVRLRRPVRATGEKILIGFAAGAILGAFRAAAGALAEVFGGGGYTNVLAILPDYWTLTSPWNQGLALAALTALLVGCGGRFAGRPGAVAGAVLSSAAWSLAIWTTPFAWSMGLGLVAALAAGALAWHHGILALNVASITALSLPTAWVAWQAFPEGFLTASVATAPFLLPTVGLAILVKAPRRGSGEDITPAYVSELQKSARLEAEIELLRSLQLSLLPAEPVHRTTGAELAWEMNPADVVGGDFLDVVEDGDGRLWIAVADAAGHGISCSVLTAFTKAAVVEHAVAGAGPAEAMAGIRGLFGRLRIQRTLVTLLLAVYDPRKRELAAVSAGHPPLLFCDQGGVRELGRPGRPLGVELGGRDDEEERLDCPGDALAVAYSDGVVEAASPSGEAFGYERWPALLPSLCGEDTRSVLSALMAEVDVHRAGQSAGDDVTAVVVRILP